MKLGKYLDLPLLKRVLALATPYKRIFGLAATLAIVLAPVGILRPWLIQITVDRHILTMDVQGMIRMMLILCVVLIVESLIRYSFIYSTNWLGQSVIRDLRVRVFKHISSLQLKHFDHTPVGTSTTRTINDVETINTVFSQGMITIVADLLTLVAVLAIMFYSSAQLTLMCLITMPLMVIATNIFRKKVKAAYEIVRNQISTMNAFLNERITGMRIVQIFNAEDKEFAKFEAINDKYKKANIDSIFYYAVFFPVVELLSASALGLMVWYGARGVIDGEVTLGVLIAFPLYLGMLFRPVRMLADKFNTLQMGLVAADRVFGILDTESKIDNNGSHIPERLQGNVSFKNVDFSYVEGSPILKAISFDLKQNETLAIVGSTGSGKTTIINILNRFYEFQAGDIQIDGLDIREYELLALRKRIAMVLQDVFLFSGTVMENISLRDKNISREKVIEASKMIGAHSFIEALPGGYDYQVMERGATLSMGQRQLISFVRALVFDPDILILDEATSSIDPETESVIQFAIETLIAKRTSIIIAHRLSTIRHADNIMVLNKGEIKEFGPHEALLKIEEGHYKKLYEMQFLQPSLEED